MMRSLSILLLLGMVACASKPQLYPNEKYKAAGKDVANEDIKQCMADSEEYLKSSKGKQVAKGAGAGAAIGAAMGAVSGMFTGNFGRGLTQGAALGAAGGGAAGAVSPDVLKQRYVNHCLAEKGYQVIGWD